jgi:hypothetical protein
MHNFIKNVEFQVCQSYLAAGSTVHNCEAVDMAGFEGVCFIAQFGTVTTANETNLHIEQGTSSSLSTASDVGDLLNSAAYFLSTQGSSSVYLVSEVYRPTDRWVRPVVDRSGANIVINTVLALKYRPGDAAVAESTDINDFAIVYSPSTGSATG